MSQNQRDDGDSGDATVPEAWRTLPSDTVDWPGDEDPDEDDATATDVRAFTNTTLYHQWFQRVASGKPNDYIIAISAHPGRTGVSGTGKTTFGLDLAKEWMDISEDGFDAETQGTLDPQELVESVYPETDAGGVMIYDEAQGTPDSTGLNSKRAMKEESLNAVLNIATRRMERKTLIIISQSLKSLVTDLYPFIDSWLLIMDDFDYIAQHYAVQPDVFNLEKRQTKTPGIEALSWNDVPESDPDKAAMDRMKEQANDPDNDDEEEAGDETLSDEQQIELAESLRERGWSLREVAGHDMIEYTRSWVRENTSSTVTEA